VIVSAALLAAAAVATPAAVAAASVTAPGPGQAEDADLAATARTAHLDAARSVVTTATALAAKADDKVDTIELDVQIAQLDDAASLPDVVVVAFTDLLDETTADVQTALTAWEKKKAAEAAALKRANTRAGAKDTARAMAAEDYGWGDGQFSCLDSLWTKESGWSYRAYNRGSGATGIPQALPGSKMASAGSDWKTSAATQIEWGLAYIDRAYGSPCAAWSHSRATNWY
jgi:hypothetical protein